jgi:hypothetical protein
LGIAAEPEIAARFITTFTQRHALLRLQRHSRAARRWESRSRFAKSKTFVSSSIRAAGIGTCLTTDAFRRFNVMNATVPASRSMASGVIASASEIRHPLHMSNRQNTRGSGGIVSAAAAYRCRSATFKYFRAPTAV